MIEPIKQHTIVLLVLSILVLPGCSQGFFFVAILPAGPRAKTAAEEAWSRPPSKSASKDAVIPVETTQTVSRPDPDFKNKTEKEIEAIFGNPISKRRVKGGFIRQYNPQEGTITIFFDERRMVSGWFK